MFRVILFFIFLSLFIYFLGRFYLRTRGSSRLEAWKDLQNSHPELSEIINSVQELQYLNQELESSRLQVPNIQVINQVTRILKREQESSGNLNDQGRRILKNYLNSYITILKKFISIRLRSNQETTLQEHEEKIIQLNVDLIKIFSKIEKEILENDLMDLEVDIKSVSEGLKLDNEKS